MEDFIFNNGIKLVYHKSTSRLTSICISLDAGAGRDGEKLGVAHATEHMVYKGTKNRTEAEINQELSSIFGFQNAMTNYPYVIYYGTLLNEDLQAGIELFSDIIINPTFKDDGFNEEMNVIKEELKEWDEELEQYCEDKLFFNSFENRRIKYPIIGTEESLDNISLEDIKIFYNKFYVAQNTTIVVVSSLDFNDIKNIISKYFNDWTATECCKDEIYYEDLKKGTFLNAVNGTNTAKVQVVFPIDNLTHDELKAFRIFNQYFGEGVNSMLFQSLRTDSGLVYDVLTKISNESYIKLYKITFSVAVENIDKALKCIEEVFNNINKFDKDINEEGLNKLIKSLKLKRLFYEEQGVRLAKELATYDSMFGDYSIYLNEVENLDKISKNFILNTALKVLKNPSIEVVSR